MPLIKGAKLSYKLLRKILEEDLRMLKAFINKYLAKGFIREFALP